MPAGEIAVAKMETELDIVRHAGRNPFHALEELLAWLLGVRHRVGRLAVPDDHLVADVPLQAKVAVRNVPAERGDFGDHRPLVGGFDGRECLADDDRAHHREGRRQAHLEADILRQFAALAGGDKVEIRGARLARVTELAEPHFIRLYAFGEREKRKTIGRAYRTEGSGRR